MHGTPQAQDSAPPPRGTHAARRLLPRVLLGAAGVALLVGGLLTTYQIALARVPHQRAVIERVLRAYTGLDLRFASLELRWGWYGPEAVFSQVELREPARSAVRMHAQLLTVGFSSWSSLRRGQLEISRITLVAPDIDLSALSAAPAAAPAASTRHAALLDPRLLAMLGHAPLGHLIIEQGTLRLRDARYGAVPVVLRVNHAQLSRTADAVAVSGMIYLPERMGQAAFIALRLEGDLAHPAQLAGNLRFVGHKLAFGPLGEWAAQVSARPELALARAGVGDCKLDLAIAHGEVVRGDGALAIGGLALRAAAGAAAADATHAWERARADLVVSRGEDALRVELRKLVLGRRGAADTQGALTLEWSDSGNVLHGTLEQLPAAALIEAAASVASLQSVVMLNALEVGGVARHAELRWNGNGAPGHQWTLSAELADLDLAAARLGWRLGHVGARLQGNESELRAALSARAASFASTALPDDITQLALEGQLHLTRTHDGWSVTSEGVELSSPDAQLRLAGSLSGGATTLAAAAAPVFELQIEIAKLQRSALERYFGAHSTAVAFAGLAALAQSGDVTDGHIRLRGRLDPDALAHVLDTRGELQVENLALFGEGHWPAAEGIAGRFSWVNERARLVVEHGSVAGLPLTEGRADWPAGATPRISLRAYGPLANALEWLRSHPDAFALAPDLAQLHGSGDLLLDFNLTPALARLRLPQAPPRWRLAAFVDRASVASAGLPELTDVTGTWLVDSGELRASRVHGRWFGGPVALSFAETRSGPRSLHVRAEGTADGAALALLLAADPAHSLSGRFDWHADLRHDLEGEGAGGWRIEGESNLLGLASNLPAPLAKAAHDALAARLQLVPAPQDSAELTLRLGNRLAVRLELAGASGGRQSISRGAVHLGEGDATAPADHALSASGRLEELDALRWLTAWPQLLAAQGGPDPRLPELELDLAVDVLQAGDERFADARLSGTLSADALDLHVAAHDLAGSVHWPTTATRGEPAQLHLERAALQASDARELAALFATLPLGQPLRLDIDELSFDALRLGHVSANLETSDGALAVRDFSARRPAQDLLASASCERAGQRCRVSFVLASRDLAATLQDFHLAPDLSAAEAKLSGELTVPLRATHPWLAGAQGELRMEIGEGSFDPSAAVPAGAAPGFALFGVTPLLAAGRVSASFTSLDASFALHDGQASTEDLRLAAHDVQVMMRGRVGLLDRDYDQRGVIVRAGDRLTDAVQRLAGPRVAAAWLALRGAVGSGPPDPQSQPFHLRGSWEAPLLEP
jgi:uncharacterized protein YhdP